MKLLSLAKVHDFTVAVMAALFFEEDWRITAVLAGWWLATWLWRIGTFDKFDDLVIDPIWEFYDCWLGSWLPAFFYSALFVIFMEGVLLYIYWEDLLNYIVSHY